MSQASLFTAQPLLGAEFPLPLDLPFTTGEALEAGVTRRTLSRLTELGYLRRMLRGVYVAAQVVDSLELRARALCRVVPRGAVVVDWTATWLYTGTLPFGQHVEVPPVSIFRLPGHGRLRNQLCRSGDRTLRREDVQVIDGITVTTPLRTALDIGRLARRDDAIGGLDALLRTCTFSQAELLSHVGRFRGHRGVVQLRELAPRADGRAQSPGESVLRLRWLDLPSLPPPEPQVPILDHTGRERYWLDLGVREIRFAAEYDGEEHHSDDADREHDRRRRAWIEQQHGWVIQPVRRSNVFGVTRDVESLLIEGVARARRELGRPR